MIKAPFNFIPVNKEVFFPDWDSSISLDKPFKDGISGCIKLKITAKSPIFVRNSDITDNGTNQLHFCNINGKYFIPGSTIKGMARSILSILSYGRLPLDKSKKFTQREWDNKELYPLKNQQKDILCGWLKRKDNEYYINDCGKPMRISQTEIDKYIGNSIMEDNFSLKSKLDLTKQINYKNGTYDPKTANYKYALLNSVKLTGLSFKKLKDSEPKVRVSKQGNIKGDIVLTGQPSKWDKDRSKKQGKYYEFVFQEKTSNSYKIPEETFKEYKDMYSENEDWKRAYKDIDNKGIPVFFRKENEKVKDFGLAYLYKLPYEKMPYKTLPKDHYTKENRFDLTDRIFGKISNTNNPEDTLKGRVHFGHAFSANAECDQEVSLVLASPKASYYPIYIKQEGENGITSQYKTYNDGIISGRKQYLRRKDTWQNEINNTKDTNSNIKSILIPLKKGTIFESKVRFHNLLPIELGALLSALTFHNNENECFHLIGQAKSFGFGKTTITAELSTDGPLDAMELMAQFEKCMNDSLKRKWLISQPIQELFNIAHFDIDNSIQYQYMRMDLNSNNEFNKSKENKEYLLSFTDIHKDSFTPKSLLAKIEEIKKAKATKIEQERKLVQEQEAREAKALIEQEQALNKELRIKSGLIFLEERNPSNEHKVKDFKGAMNRIDRWLKESQNTTIPNNELGVLITTMKRLKSNASRKEIQDWENPQSQIWKKLALWTNNTLNIKNLSIHDKENT